MARAYYVIGAGHILEPLDLWDKYIDPEFRERRPRFTIDEPQFGGEYEVYRRRTSRLIPGVY